MITQSGLGDYLLDAASMGASDLHITAGLPPMVRISGKVEPLDYPTLTTNATRDLIYDLLSNDQRQRLENEWELDFSYALPRSARFRVNVYFQRGAIGAAFRTIPSEIKSISELGLPKAVEDLTEKPRGLVLVTGPTGSGKSTSLASMIDKINETRHEHIMSVEDPIEFLHEHKQCIVNQREVNQDTKSFAQALKHVLRQDPDVILVGEMRDLETIALAITAAETGHLVFGTLHTQDAPQTIDRIIDVFPPHQQHQIRAQLANRPAGHHHPDAHPHLRWQEAGRGMRGADADAWGEEPHQGGKEPSDLLSHADRRQVRDADHGRGARRPRAARTHLPR